MVYLLEKLLNEEKQKPGKGKAEVIVQLEGKLFDLKQRAKALVKIYRQCKLWLSVRSKVLGKK